MKKMAGIFSSLVGSSVVILWVILLYTEQVPELATESVEIYFHITAELIMAILLIISGIGIIIGCSWSIRMFTFSSGFLVYSIINSSGYYIENENSLMLIIFSIILVINLILLIQTYRK